VPKERLAGLVKQGLGLGPWPRESSIAKYRIGGTMNRAAVIGNGVAALFQSLLPHKNNCGFTQNKCFSGATGQIAARMKRPLSFA
jgi:hypothetical protein